MFGHHPISDAATESAYDEATDAFSEAEFESALDAIIGDQFLDFSDPLEDEEDFQRELEHALANDDECLALECEWEPGMVWDTYPHELHRSKRGAPPWDVLGYHTRMDGKNYIHVHHTKCKGTLATQKEKDEHVCSTCATIPNLARWDAVNERARKEELSEHMPWQYLTHAQLLRIARTVRRHNRILRSRVQSLQKQLDRAHNRLTDTKRILTFLSEYDVPGLRRLLAVAIRRGCSPVSLFSQLEKAVKQMYKPHGNYSRREYDIAFIAKALGGPRLLYAMGHAFGLPSTATLLRNSHIPEIRPCLGSPVRSDMEYGIGTLYDPAIRSPPRNIDMKRAGKQVMVDGVACEEVCRYCPKRNAVCGLCREHAGTVNVTVTDFDAIKAIEDALDGKRVHVGKDATVLAVSSIADPDDYIPIPILVSTSCKKETSENLAHWLGLFLQVWKEHPNGEAIHGPIMTIASDGESTFRSARFELAMCEDMDIETQHGYLLSKLRGFNMRTGKDGLIATCDYKHIFKRESTTGQVMVSIDQLA